MGDYVTDVPYVRSFQPDLVPERLRAVAALNGFAPPPAERFAYCELGCGLGDTLVALAAANPESSFVGIDLNPEHIREARRTATDGGVENVTFLEADFTTADCGPFDYVVAHGVLSWVGPEVRDALVTFAAARTRPGALLFVSYNALPAWSSVMPLRQLLLGAGGTTSLERAERGLALAKRLAGADYLVNNPPARAMLDLMERGGLRYIVHEYLHAHWAPLYFADVARSMLAGGLPYVGSLPLHANYRDLVLPPGIAFDTEDRVTFEGLKDYAVDTWLRRDVFACGPAARSPEHTAAWLATTSFALAEPDDGVRERALPHRTLAFAGPAFEVAIARLAEGSATGLPADVLLRLLLAERIVPVHGATLRFDPEGVDRYAVPLAYNRMVLARPYASDLPIVVASPVTGSAHRLGAVEAVALRLLTEIAPADREAFLAEHFGRPGIRMTKGERTIDAPAERMQIVRDGVADVEKRLVPKLVELGVLEPT